MKTGDFFLRKSMSRIVLNKGGIRVVKQLKMFMLLMILMTGNLSTSMVLAQEAIGNEEKMTGSTPQVDQAEYNRTIQNIIDEPVHVGNSLGDNFSASKHNLSEISQFSTENSASKPPTMISSPALTIEIISVNEVSEISQEPNPLVTPVHAEDQGPSTKVSYRKIANQSKMKTSSRVALKISDQSLEQMINILIEDLFDSQNPLDPEIQNHFDLFYHFDVMFKELSHDDLAEPMVVQVLLYDGEEVEDVVRYDIEEHEDIESIDFDVEEVSIEKLSEDFAGYDKAKIKGDTARILVYKITQSGDYGICFK